MIHAVRNTDSKRIWKVLASLIPCFLGCQGKIKKLNSYTNKGLIFFFKTKLVPKQKHHKMLKEYTFI